MHWPERSLLVGEEEKPSSRNRSEKKNSNTIFTIQWNSCLNFTSTHNFLMEVTPSFLAMNHELE